MGPNELLEEEREEHADFRDEVERIREFHGLLSSGRNWSAALRKSASRRASNIATAAMNVPQPTMPITKPSPAQACQGAWGAVSRNHVHMIQPGATAPVN